MSLLLNEGLVVRIMKDLRPRHVLLTASRITLARAITKRQLRGTLERPMKQTEQARGAQAGANTDL